MRRFVHARLVSAMMALLGATTGCGDDTRARTDGGGTGGNKDGGAAGQMGGSGGGGQAAGNDGGGLDADGGGDAGETKACYSVTFIKPINSATLTAVDDKDGDNCVNGFQYDVQITTDAPNLTDVTLFAGTAQIGTAKVATGAATFSGVQLASAGDTLLSIQFPSTAKCTDPTTQAKVTINCKVPACSVSKPTISGMHPSLNAVKAPAGDRVSTDGSPYQVAFEVTTDIEDGQDVTLSINEVATPGTVTTTTQQAAGGKASFAGVALSPDGRYQVEATCKAKNAVGRSTKGTYPVDTVPPDLAVSKPAAGAFIGPSMLTSGKFQVCGKTTAADAVGLAASLGPGANNFCVTVGGAKACAPVLTAGTDVCLDIACTGGAPFDITVDLSDAAGNPATRTIAGVSCSSTLPSVQIIAPVSDAPTFTDPSKHLLAATSSQRFKDKSAVTPGAQTDVVACTNRAGSAALFVGHKGDATLAQLGATVTAVAAAAGSGCPAGFGFIATFADVTLPESTEAADGSLATSTETRVDLTDAFAATGSSPALDIWVDSVAPVVSVMTPANLCGSFHQSNTTFTSPVTLNSDTGRITLTITNGSSTDTYMTPTFVAGVATFSSAVFSQGANALAAVATDPAGNATALQPVPCTVTVGAAPVIVFTAPTAGKLLCAATSTAANCINDADPGTAGWQGTLSVHVTGGGAPQTTGNVTFSVGSTMLGVAALNGSGDAQLTNVTLADGATTITSTTDNIPGRGVGTGTVNVTVDLTPPTPPAGLMATVLDRRQSSFQLSWTAPSDATTTVAGYQVRYAKVPITSGNFDDVSITGTATYSGSPAAPSAADGVVASNLAIEQDYYFAVAAVDTAGNRSIIAATGVAARAAFSITVLSGSGTDAFGFDFNGTGDFGRPAGLSFTGDGLSDLVVGGTGSHNVYIFFGASTGYAATPSVTITGSTNGFGEGVVNAGDLDGDGLDDIAIASRSDNGGRVYIFSRKNPPASWGTTTSWPAALTEAQANYVISVAAPLAGAMFTRPLSRLGNFDGTGSDDLAIGFALRGSLAGSVVILRGSTTFSSISLPDTTNTVQIDGTAAGSGFGVVVMGIGRFFGGTTFDLVSSAALTNTVYAFRGQAPAGGTLTTAMADDSTIRAASGDRYGITLGFLGPLGASPGAVTIGSTQGSYVDVNLGTLANGPFLGVAGSPPSPTVHLVDAASGNSFSVVNFGGGIIGTSRGVSLIGGDAIPDLVVAGQGEPTNPIYIINGSAISSLSGTVDVSAAQAAVVPSILKVSRLPSPWAGYTIGRVITDLNGDGVADFAIGEYAAGGPGRLVVFY